MNEFTISIIFWVICLILYVVWLVWTIRTGKKDGIDLTYKYHGKKLKSRSIHSGWIQSGWTQRRHDDDD
ncbi:hypothetical protein CCS41_08640 [Candidatus Fukatsuia symbiotica]|uniref:Uncharacterized protein n=1 Tax=Candidatus Fukatsuia symbiotica TaxID=1878942 RepID=A0A2U8I609_9GAMM|nr:hypothetical protein CCS41_08640 [Candidatus Fukatsuia symbiotica]